MQVDGIRMKFYDSMRRHDSVTLDHSGMTAMASHLTIGDEGRNAKVGSDEVFPRSDHVSPSCTEAELAAMTPPDRVIAKISNKINNGPRLVVEDCFNEQMRKFAH